MDRSLLYKLEVIKVKEDEAGNCGLRIVKPEDVFEAFRFIGKRVNESLYIVCLDTRNNTIGYHEVARGSVNVCGATLADVLFLPLVVRAKNVLMIHNHPSGEARASTEDITFTKKCIEGFKTFGLNLLDHIIIGGDSYVSIKEISDLFEGGDVNDKKV